MATHNYLGFAGNVEIEKAAVETIRKYGVGSCGPRGFYGTVGKHLERNFNLLSVNYVNFFSIILVNNKIVQQMFTSIWRNDSLTF
jgi:hypothetical protein